MKEFIEAPHLQTLLDIGKLSPITREEPYSYSYGGNAMSFQAESQYGNSVKRLDRPEIDKMLTGQRHLADFSPGL